MIFWFRFVFPYISQLEEGREDEILAIIKRDFSQHVSFAFEDVAREATKILYPDFHIGSWWEATRTPEGERGSTEIDILGTHERAKELLVGECKSGV